MDLLLAIDQGTTATVALIINSLGQVVSKHSQNYPQHYPKEGFVEHYGTEIKESVKIAVTKAISNAQINPKNIKGVGVTNQRETLCIFDKQNNPVMPFIVWQCRRSTEICQQLKNNNFSSFIQEKTGLLLDPYFSASKILWLFKEYPYLKKDCEQNKLLLGTVDSFITHWFSGGELHITDITNASRTMLMDIDTKAWSKELLELFEVPLQALPTIVDNSSIYGYTKGLSFLPDGIAIAALAGDQQAALFGQTCFNKGDAKATFGTGCFILLNTGEEKILSKHGLLTSIAYKLKNKTNYCLEGSAFVAGAAIDFLVNSLGIINKVEDVETLAKEVVSSEGVIFVPALCGLGTPFWQPHARGVLAGLSRGSTKAHIARAVLEGVALQNEAIFSAMAKDGLKPSCIKIDGGASTNDLWMQIQADITDVPSYADREQQKTALGVAYLAGLALNLFDIESIKSFNQVNKYFSPNMNKWERQSLIERYQKIINNNY